MLKELIIIRLSCHNLNIERGRHGKFPREDRLCMYCNTSDVEDEYHFCLICPNYHSLQSLIYFKILLRSS